MKAITAQGTLAAVLLSTGFAAASPDGSQPDRYGPRNTVSVHPLSLSWNGVAIEYERFIAPPNFSLALGAGYRSSASSRSDYASDNWATGVELRYWAWSGARPYGVARKAMVGPYLGAQIDVSWLRMEHRKTQRYVGGNISLSEVASLGWRFAVARRVELTPSFGVGARTDFDPDGRLSPWTRWLVRGSLTLGVLF